MNNSFNRRDFIKTIGAGTAALLTPAWTEAAQVEGKTDPVLEAFPQLKNIEDKFSFAIFADPQVGQMGSTARVPMNARRTQIQAIEEINNMETKPAFAAFLGDLVNTPDDSSFANFRDCIKHAKMPRILMHGNHDTRPPYTKYLETQKKINGMDEIWYSFDAGKWHFIHIPCNLNGRKPIEKEYEAKMLDWLEKDLAANKERPTMFFEHLHMVPLGLSQLEWYTFRLELRKKILDLLTKYGNVKYYFNGHVHNGIKAAVKMAKKYKGINFITVPTIIEGRNFGEEYQLYEHGLPVGGYYMIVHVDGEDVKLEGRLVNVKQGHIFPEELPEFTEDQEPRWFKKIVEFEPNEKIINGNFEDELKGWYKPLRYIADRHPAFEIALSDRYERSGEHSAFVFTRAKGREFWARDDNNHLYQVVKPPKGNRPILNASYYMEERPENAGGYVRISGISGEELKFLMMFHWGDNEQRADYLPRCFGYEIHGWQQNWAWLYDLGKKRKGFYWKVPDDPGQWHDLKVDLRDIYERSIGQLNTFDKLGIDKYHLQIGTWTNPQSGSKSGAYFDRISLTASENKSDSKVDDYILPVNEWVFLTRFGQDLYDKETRRRAQRQGKMVMNEPK